MQMLIDTIPLHFELVEDSSGSGRLIAKGPFARGDEPTANGRFYPGQIWRREIAKLESKMSGSSLFGMLDHPKDGKTSLKEASHLVRSLNYDGNQVLGELEVLDTPVGQIAKSIIESGARIGVSSRGLGTTKKDAQGRDVVQDDYKLLTFDLVADPAASSAWPRFATEDVEDAPMATTTDELRSKYPDLVKQIEASALAAAAAPEEKPPAGPTQQEMEEKLMAMIAEQRQELEEKVRGELLSDPEVGGSRLALESVTRILRPYLLPEDAEAAVQNKDEEIKGLQTKISELEERVKEQEGVMEEMVGDLEAAARLYFMEKKLSEHAEPKEKERVISLMGDVGRFNSHEEFKTAMASCCERVIEDGEKAKTESERVTALESALQEEREAREKAVKLATALGARAYAERRLANHPHAPALREAIDSMGAMTNEQVDQILEAWDAEHSTSDDFDRIQTSLRSGLDHVPNAENDDGSNGYGTMTEGASTFFGIEKRELQERAGIDVSVLYEDDKRPY
jgi:hypothetical protein